MNSVKKISIATIVLLLFLALSSNLFAATFTLNTTDDTADASVGDGVCADSSGNCSLRAAIYEANHANNAGFDYIEIDPSLATPVVLTLTSKLPDVKDSLTFNNSGTNQLTADQLTIDINGTVTNTYGFYFNTPTDDGVFTFSGVTITNGDYSNVGGAIIVQGGETLNLLGCVISNNTAASNGGALYAAAGTTINIENSTFSGNQTTGTSKSGGALMVMGNSTVSIENSTFSDNHATKDGGAIKLSSGTHTVTNVTISGNYADGNAGGIYIAGSSVTSAEVTLNNVTIMGNVADADNLDGGVGGGIIAGSYSNLNIKNSIIADNYVYDTLSNCDRVCCPKDGNFISAGNNISDDATCNLVDASDLENTDPILAALADNGGLTQTHLPLVGSPAIDAIVGNCVDQAAGDILQDQRGFVRPTDGDSDTNSDCDVGASEYDAVKDIDSDGDDYTENTGDCDDTDTNVNPDVTEICDTVDNDCDGSTDEDTDVITNCGVGECSSTGLMECIGGVLSADDCVSGAPSADICDGLDNDCDGTADEFTDETTSCGVGECSTNGVVACVGGVYQPDNCVPDAPSAEVCDGLDNDCDGTADNGADVSTTCGEGECSSTGVIACVGGVAQSDDCVPGAPSIEVCDGLDNDCDGVVDDSLDQTTTCGVGECGSTGVIACVGGVTQTDTCVPGTPSTEVCGDGIDQDCDGQDLDCPAETGTSTGGSTGGSESTDETSETPATGAASSGGCSLIMPKK